MVAMYLESFLTIYSRASNIFIKGYYDQIMGSKDWKPYFSNKI